MERMFVYSLIKTFYEEKGDYIDSFLPIVLTKTPVDKSGIEVVKLKEKILLDYEIDIPLHSLNIIINRAKRRGLLDKSRTTVRLTEEGESNRIKDGDIRSTERKINELIGHAKNYVFEKYNLNYDDETIRKNIYNLVNKNMSVFDMFFSSGRLVKSGANGELDSEIVGYLLNYVEYIEQNVDAHFNTLKDIVFGSVISASIYSNTIEDLGRGFEKTSIYIDTNFAFNLLGLHHAEQCGPTIELYKMLKGNEKFNFRIFDFTVDEMVKVLRGYKLEHSYYDTKFKIDTIYSSLKSRGWLVSNVTEFISNIEDRLASVGISILRTGKSIEKYITEEAEVIELQKYKKDQKAGAQKHDLYAINYVKKLRDHDVRKIENCKVMFLTSDLKLARFNHDFHHAKTGTINEAIPERLFTNIIWLKSPKSAKMVPLSTIITAYKSDNLINRRIWKTFLEIVSKLRVSGKVDDSAISALFYESGFNEVFLELSKEEESITPEYVLDLIEDAKERHDKKIAETIKIKEYEMQAKDDEVLKKNKVIIELSEHLARVSEKDLETASYIEDQIQGIKDACSQSARIGATRINYEITALIVFLLLFVFSSVAKIVIKEWNQVEPISFLVQVAISTLIIVTGVRFDSLNKLKTPLINKYENHLYSRLVRGRSSEINTLEGLLKTKLN